MIHLGTVRFLFACLVALSHYPNSHMPLNLGVSSVVGFYFLAGYLMASSYQRFLPLRHPILSFYTDRFLRVYPAFLLVYLATLLFYRFIGIETIGEPSILLELLIIPQNYIFFGEPFTNYLMPPAWSLGAELQWYLLVPFIVLLSNRLKVLILFVALIGQDLVFLPHLTHLFDGYANDFCQVIGKKLKVCSTISDVLGYRLLTFIIGTFLMGHLFYESKKHPWINLVFYLAYVHFILVFFYFRVLKNDFHYLFAEVYVGYLLLMPLIANILTAPRCQHPRLKIVDKILGKFSYPIFLSHFLGLWTAKKIAAVFALPFYQEITLAWTMTFSISTGLVFFQDALDKWRYARRGFISFEQITQKQS